MSEIVQPKAIPCFSFRNFCPTFRFKRLVKRESVPTRDQNPILNDKKFINLKEQDASTSKKISPEAQSQNKSE